MDKKEKYLKDINERFSGKAKELLFKQLDLFYEDNNDVMKNRYKIGDDF